MLAGRVADLWRRLLAAARRRLRRQLATGGAQAPNASVDALPEAQLWALSELYEGRFEAAPISFATVRDYADSLDNLGGLARAGGGLRAAQRCWVVKTILGAVPRGSRLLEIGGEEPLAAGLLSRLGYDVTVVDPLDGSRRGSSEHAAFVTDYPDVSLVRDRFPPARPLPGGYDAIYSVSVLGQEDRERIEELLACVHELLGRDGHSIHTIDHVLAGWGADARRRGLERIVSASELDQALLTATLERMEQDPETYLVSAEAHNEWRGDVAYDSFPMRRIGSVQICRRVGD